MAEEKDEFDSAFGETEDEDFEEEPEDESDEDGDEQAEGDPDDFSQDWGAAPLGPVKFGKASTLVKILKWGVLVLMVLAPIGIGAAVYFTGFHNTVLSWFEGSDEEEAVAEELAEGKEEKVEGEEGAQQEVKKDVRSSPFNNRPALGGGEEPERPVGDIDSSKVRLVLRKPAVVWIDGVSLGKVRKKKVELEHGEHRIRVVLRKKKGFQEVIDIDGDKKSYVLKINPKKKTIELK
ncbi:MAG: hypothetical protein VYA34_12210 [Myxococcota bacterium]|nr:hypothetical protein [Myxococcota bacterium]